MKHNNKPWLLALAAAIPLSIGGLSAMLTGDMMKDYFFINKPALSPPGWVFPIVWSILYLIMGYASYLVITSEAERSLKTKAILFYGIQLILNFFWSILFFNYSLYLWAFIELMVMWTVILITSVLFYRARPKAGLLMIPYILWTTFAAYLNIAVYLMSRTDMPMPR